MAQAARKVTARDKNEKLAHGRLTALELAYRTPRRAGGFRLIEAIRRSWGRSGDLGGCASTAFWRRRAGAWSGGGCSGDYTGATRPSSQVQRSRLSARLASPSLALARASPTVRTTRRRRCLWQAKTCSSASKHGARLS